MPPRVAIVMGSRSDWPTMQHAAATLEELGIDHDVRILSAHRTPEALFEYVAAAEQAGVQVWIAAAGGAAHLAGVVAAKTTLPVLGVPMESKIQGVDSLLSMVQMPAGVPVATFAIGKAGAINAALFAAQILSLGDAATATTVRADRRARAQKVLSDPDPRLPPPESR